VTAANGSVIGGVTDPATIGAYRVRIGNIPPGQQATVTIVVDTVKVRDKEPVKPGVTGGNAIGTAGQRGGLAIWAAFGSTYPHGGFSNGYKRDLAVNAGFEYGLGNNWAIEATLGRHSFKGKGGLQDIDVLQYGVDAKLYFPMPSWRPFVTAGIGGYDFDPGSTRFGANLGAGAQVDIAPRWSVEGRYAYHWVSGNSPNSRYSTLLLGLRYSF